MDNKGEENDDDSDSSWMFISDSSESENEDLLAKVLLEGMLVFFTKS